jgi:hypothetical protein
MSGRQLALSIENSDASCRPRKARRGSAEDEVERVVAHLKRICRNSSLEFALHVGSVIIHYFYDGDTEGWRSRGPKTTSFRRLAEHPELPMSPGALYRCVALFELCDRLDAPARWRNLGASHLRTVLGLPVGLQERVLSEANSKRWTVQTLDLEVRKHKVDHKPRGGRRSQSRLAIGLGRLQHCIAKCGQVLEGPPYDDGQQLQSSLHCIAKAQESLDRLAEELSKRIRESTLPPRNDAPGNDEMPVIEVSGESLAL